MHIITWCTLYSVHRDHGHRDAWQVQTDDSQMQAAHGKWKSQEYGRDTAASAGVCVCGVW